MSKVDRSSKDKNLLDEALLEALLAQIGQDEWWKLSEKERQQKLMEMRLKERKLRREGWLKAVRPLPDINHFHGL